MAEVTGLDIYNGLEKLGLKNKDLEIHSSLSSFGYVKGGAITVINSLRDLANTILMPTYSSIGRTGAPENDHPLQNGADYRKKADYTIEPFDPE